MAIGGDTLVYAAPGTAGGTSHNNTTGTSVPSIQFSGDANSFTLTGNAVTLTGDLSGTIIQNDSPNTQTVNLPIALGANGAINAASGDVAVGGAISGAGFGLTKSGPNQLALSGANTFTGGVTLNAGRLNINYGGTNASAIGTGRLTINGGTLGNTSSGAVTLATNNPQTWAAEYFTFSGPQDLNLGTGPVTLTVDPHVTVTGGNLTVGGSFNGGTSLGLGKDGAGTLTLAGPINVRWVAVGDGTLLLAPGASGAINYFAANGGVRGSMVIDIGSGGKITTNGWTVIDSNGAGEGGLKLVSGAYSTVSMSLGDYGGGGGSDASYVQTGGTFTDSGIFTIANYSTLGSATISGGSFTAAGPTYIGIRGTATMTISGTATANLPIGFGHPSISTTNMQTLNLDGGRLNTSAIATARSDTQATFNFNGGTLATTAAGTYFTGGSSYLRANVRNGGAIIDDGGYAVAIDQALLHSDVGGDNAIDGGLTKRGGGILTLGGANDYTGPTTISNGLLVINGYQAAATGNVSVGSGAALGGIGTVGDTSTAVSVATNAAIRLTSDAAVGTLTLGGSLTFNGTVANPSQLYFDLGSGMSVTDMIVTGGAHAAANPAGSVLVSLNQLSGYGVVTPGTYTLIQGGATSTFTGYQLATTRAGGNVYSALGASGNNLQVTVDTATPGPIAGYWTGAANTLWTGANWNDQDYGGIAVPIPGVGTNVTFATTNPIPPSLTTTLGADFEINSLTVASDIGATTIGGTHMLTIDATDANFNTAGNGITVNNVAGTTISAKVGLGDSQTWTVGAGATLAVSGAINDFGAGRTLTKAGAGTLTLSGNNTFTGPLTVTTGTVSVPTVNDAGAAGPLGSGASVVLGSNTTDGTLRLTGTAVTYSSTKNFTIAPGGTGSGNGYIQVDNPTTNLTLSGTINAAGGGLYKTGAGQLTFTGPLKVGTGTTYLGLNVNAGKAYFGPGAGGTLSYFFVQYLGTTEIDIGSGSFASKTGGYQQTRLIADTTDIVNFRMTSGYYGTWGMEIGYSDGHGVTGVAEYYQTGGTFENTGTGGYGYIAVGNQIRGKATIAGGLFTSPNMPIYIGRGMDGTLTITGGTVNSSAIVFGEYGNNTYKRVLNLDGGTLMTGAITATSDRQATFNFNGGTLIAKNDATFFTPPATNLQRLNVRNNGAIIDTGSYAVTIADALQHSNIAGDLATDGGLTKQGGGMLTLSAANTYNGLTAVSSGALKLTGSVQSTSATVAAGATLELAGTAGSSLRDDASVGNNGTLNVSSTMAQSVGTVTGAGTTQVAANASLSATSIVQNTLTIGAGGSVTIRETSVAGNASPVPEPAMWVLLGTALMGLLAFRRRR